MRNLLTLLVLTLSALNMALPAYASDKAGPASCSAENDNVQGCAVGMIANAPVTLTRWLFFTTATGTMEPGLRQGDIAEKLTWQTWNENGDNVDGSPYSAARTCNMLKQHLAYMKRDGTWPDRWDHMENGAETLQTMLQDDKLKGMFFPKDATGKCDLMKLPDAYCNSLLDDITLDRGETAECVSETHAFIIDSSENWASVLEQVLDRDAPGKLEPGVILTCDAAKTACERHRRQLMEAINAWNLPIYVRMSS